MLRANEFSAGTFKVAAPGSLILPRDDHEAAAIVGLMGEAPTAVFLSGEYQFQFMTTNTNWAGLIVPNVTVEVDETSACDPGYGKARVGCIIRTGKELSLCAKSEQRRIGNIIMLQDLPELKEHSVGFSRWQVVIGEGNLTRILFKVDANKAQAAG